VGGGGVRLSLGLGGDDDAGWNVPWFPR
jgi:hypothetical protein